MHWSSAVVTRVPRPLPHAVFSRRAALRSGPFCFLAYAFGRSTKNPHEFCGKYMVSRDEVERATADEARAYLLGALHDGTVSRLHRTVRIAQADVRWLHVLQVLFRKLGARSWIYREGSTRQVWIVESTYRVGDSPPPQTVEGQLSFVRGYFDAEGGIPNRPGDRFYIQLTQRDRNDLERVRATLVRQGIQCGTLHNPSARVDPDYWRFYVRTSSHMEFIQRVGSWHPRKRVILEARALRGGVMWAEDPFDGRQDSRS